MRRHPDLRSTPSLDHVGRHPSDEAHCVFESLELLDQLGLASWAPHLMGFMRRYDGIAEFLTGPDEQAPMALLRSELTMHKALQPFARLDPEGLKMRIATRLACAKFTDYGLAFHLRSDPNAGARGSASPKPPRRIRWDPLKQPLLDFLASEPVDAVYELDVSDCSRLGASEQAITEYLLRGRAH